jgi:DNA replication and repair protein RecF
LLEAIFFLGRGRSFRAADNRVLIQRGQEAAEIVGCLRGPSRLGIRIASGGLEIHMDGRAGASTAELASSFPVEALHADIGSVIQGPPEVRRRLLDWGLFHVEHQFLPRWRDYRRALMQRNAALRTGSPDALLDAWDAKLVEAGAVLDDLRRHHVGRLTTDFRALAEGLLGVEVGLQYRAGWSADHDLATALRDARENDRALGYTRTGPHRADLQVVVADDSARWRTSKGQQKLLGAALVLALCRIGAAAAGHPLALLVDEPAADLDPARLRRLLACLLETPAQVFLAAITVDNLDLPAGKAMFHVEHGTAKALL